MKDKNLYAVVLAGGSGTRFWPKSRLAKPKQFLDIIGTRSLLKETLARISTKLRATNIYIVTSVKYKKEVVKQIQTFAVPSKNILLEPKAKNTAPAVCWAAAKIYKENPDALLAVLPSDHLILKKGKYLSVLSQAVRLAKKDFLVTFGIVPSRPETGYGYLKTVQKKGKGYSYIKVDRFTEKPNKAKAKKFIKNKNYFWNSGMFMWKCSVILEEFEKYLPKVHKMFITGDSQSFINRNWGKLSSVSIDYGILEKSKRVAVVKAANIGWSDLGSWESLTEVLTKDKKGNILKGDCLAIKSRNSFVWGHKKFIAVVGLDDITVIDTQDALLVCQTKVSQDVKDVVSYLVKLKRNEL